VFVDADDAVADETIGLRRMMPSSFGRSSEPINMSLLVIYLWLALVAIMIVITVIIFKYKRPVRSCHVHALYALVSGFPHLFVC